MKFKQLLNETYSHERVRSIEAHIKRLEENKKSIEEHIAELQENLKDAKKALEKENKEHGG
jgi:hypothetical protein